MCNNTARYLATYQREIAQALLELAQEQGEFRYRDFRESEYVDDDEVQSVWQQLTYPDSKAQILQKAGETRVETESGLSGAVVVWTLGVQDLSRLEEELCETE